MRILSYMYVLVILPLVFTVGVGCQTPEPTLSQLEQGKIYMIPGIEGVNWLTHGSGKALRDSGIKSAIYWYDWDFPLGLLLNLFDYEGNLEQAEWLSGSIVEYQEQYPGRPVDIVSYSGGCGLTLMALEAMPEGCMVRNVILVHAAVDPKHDLTEALGHVEGKLVNFYSRWDWFFLGLGTSVFGTIDRHHTFSAGNKGFDLGSVIFDQDLKGKVIQHQWEWGMFGTGHYGGHFPIGSYGWTKEYLAPYLVKE